MTDLHKKTDEELAAMTDDQIDALVILQCAREGIPLQPPKPDEPTEPDSQPDTTVYLVGGETFEYLKDAEKVLTALQSGKRINVGSVTGGYSYGYPDRILGPDNSTININHKKVFAPETAKRVKEIWENYKEIKEDYNKQNRDWESNHTRVKEIRDTIMNPIKAARSRSRRRQEIARAFNIYSELSGEQNEITMNFLRNAYPDINQLFKDDEAVFKLADQSKEGPLAEGE